MAKAGCDVTVVPTEAALKFVGAPTWAALSGKPVATDVWTGVDEVNHVRIGQQAELVIVAPATADVMARAAAGHRGQGAGGHGLGVVGGLGAGADDGERREQAGGQEALHAAAVEQPACHRPHGPDQRGFAVLDDAAG